MLVARRRRLRAGCRVRGRSTRRAAGRRRPSVTVATPRAGPIRARWPQPGVRPHQRSNWRSSFPPVSSTTVRSIHPPIRSSARVTPWATRGRARGGSPVGRRTAGRTSVPPARAPPAPRAPARRRSRRSRLITGRAQLRVEVAHRFEEHLSQPRPVHRVVGAGAAFDLLRQPPRAHGVGTAQQVGRDLGQRVRLHRPEATALRWETDSRDPVASEPLVD